MDNEKLNKKIKHIFEKNKYSQETGDIKPILYPKFRNTKNLVIGLNPSLTDKIKEALKGSEYEGKIGDVKEYFKRASDEDIVEIEKICKDNYATYFGRFNDLFGEKNWEHIDLFFYRETEQSKIRDSLEKIFLKNTKSKNEKPEEQEINFFREQFNLAWKFIEEFNPELILVNNALASKIIQKEKKINSDNFDEKKGVHYIKIRDKKIPIFFSGMLSGQRALDNGSFKRLKWHIKNLDKIKLKK